ncbi:hypothetical protein BDV97DRAFT_421018 [Delphinella strobiligena]|nr:hypothetical protein BDV97DRAFT_421018 [Delphinella strobiligena]
MIARVDAGMALASDLEKRLRVDKEDERGMHEEVENDHVDQRRSQTVKQQQHQQQQQQQQQQQKQQEQQQQQRQRQQSPPPPQHRPQTPRRTNYPDSIVVQTNNESAPTASTNVPARARNKSPYRPPYTPSRGHLRSRSAGIAPPMARAHSSPEPSTHSTGQFTRSPASPPTLPLTSGVRSPSLRSLSPFQPLLEGSVLPSFDGGIESISEDAELSIQPRSGLGDAFSQPIPLHATLNSARPLSVRRQRPTSPLHSLANTSYASTSRSSSAASSPSVPSARYNEGFPALQHYSSTSSFSSLPSTPTSTRSRSPSVSSLETIEDAPDLEWEAIESDRAAKLKAAETVESAGDGETRRRGSLDIPGARSGSGFGFGFGRRGDNSKKRWSVCGGERRADLDLETIWED